MTSSRWLRCRQVDMREKEHQGEEKVNPKVGVQESLGVPWNTDNLVWRQSKPKRKIWRLNAKLAWTRTQIGLNIN